MTKEIGSEFWLFESGGKNEIPVNGNVIYTVSGRTALDIIIRDIKINRIIKTAYLPSYCCHTMIEPFITNNIKVLFYDVTEKKDGGLEYEIDYKTNCDIVLFMNYFGFNNIDLSIIGKQFKNNGTVVINDITHSLLSNNKHYGLADYVYGSFRKWTWLNSGGFAYKVGGSFDSSFKLKENLFYIELREKAAKKKKEFINKICREKEHLRIYNQAEEFLENHYRNYSIDSISLSYLKCIDFEAIKKTRKENAQTLLQNISNKEYAKPMFKNINLEDVPLVIPILIKTGDRDDLRKYLIDNHIYCPIHWPLSKLHNISDMAKHIYEQELSLICDQRYNKSDMIHMVDTIENYYERY